MLAAQLETPGGPIHVREVGPPDVGPDEVLVTMSLAAINPLDRLVAQGRLYPDAPVPRTLGVEGVGWADGRRVVVHGYGIGLTRHGTFAEQIAAPRTALIPVPDEVSDEQAAAVAVSLATAVRVVDLAAPAAGQTALVLGAAGNVGSALCALLLRHGVTVLGQTRDPARATVIADAGAAPVIAADPGALSRIDLDAVDIVADPLAGAWTSAAIDLLRYGGTLVLFGASSGTPINLEAPRLYRKALTIRGYGGVYEPPRQLREAVERTLMLLRHGDIRVRVSDRLPLRCAPTAVANINQAGGKTLLEISPSR